MQIHTVCQNIPVDEDELSIDTCLNKVSVLILSSYTPKPFTSSYWDAFFSQFISIFKEEQPSETVLSFFSDHII